MTAAEHRLPQGQPVSIGGGVELTLRSLEDSRCPQDVECVWAGDLVAAIEWSDPSGRSTVELRWEIHEEPTTAPGGAWTLSLITAVDGVAVVDVQPAP